MAIMHEIKWIYVKLLTHSLSPLNIETRLNTGIRLSNINFSDLQYNYFSDVVHMLKSLWLRYILSNKIVVCITVAIYSLYIPSDFVIHSEGLPSKCTTTALR